MSHFLIDKLVIPEEIHIGYAIKLAGEAFIQVPYIAMVVDGESQVYGINPESAGVIVSGIVTVAAKLGGPYRDHLRSAMLRDYAKTWR